MLDHSLRVAAPSSAVPAVPSKPSSALSPMPVSPAAVSALQTSIASALRQAQVGCEARHWEKVIAACESAIASCESAMTQTQQSPSTKGAEPSSAALPFKDLSSDEQSRIQRLLDAAADLKQKNNISEAVRAYLKVLQQQPRTYAAYNRLRYNLMRYDIAEGDPIFQEIVDVCQEIVDRFPGLQAARVTLAYGLTKLGKTPAAIACYRRTSDPVTPRRLGTKVSPSSEASLEGPRRSPDFMVIGAEKSGTTSLFQYLYQHPDILSPVEKEIDFFDLEYKYGLDWYLAHFPASRVAQGQPESRQIVGETSANYLYHKLAPARVFQHFPNIQLVVLLRHPVDRTISRYNMMVRNGSESRTLEVAIAQELRQIQQATTPDGIPLAVLNRCRHIGNSLYYYHLQRWLTYFPREQLLVLPSESLFAQPAQTLGELCRTLKIGPPPEQAYPKYNAGEYSAGSLALRQQLNAFYQPHVSQLESLLSQSFAWDLST